MLTWLFHWLFSVPSLSYGTVFIGITLLLQETCPRRTKLQTTVSSRNFLKIPLKWAWKCSALLSNDFTLRDPSKLLTSPTLNYFTMIFTQSQWTRTSYISLSPNFSNFYYPPKFETPALNQTFIHHENSGEVSALPQCNTNKLSFVLTIGCFGVIFRDLAFYILPSLFPHCHHHHWHELSPDWTLRACYSINTLDTW